MKKIEFIESYIKPDDGGDYQWNDNHGRLIRCKDCKHWFNAPVSDGYNSCEKDALIRYKDFFCANGELRGDSE